MNLSGKVIGLATAAALSLSLPAFAQSTTTTVPQNVTVPNSNVRVHCDQNGHPIVTSGANATTSPDNAVPGTPVTQNNPSGTGTTTTQTPTLAKPTTAAQNAAQCPSPTTNTNTTTTTTMPSTTTYPAQTQSTGNGPGGTQMDALNGNPNGSNWLDKFNRPTIATAHPKHRLHRVKRSTGGGH